jgi:hypothetical protein
MTLEEVIASYDRVWNEPDEGAIPTRAAKRRPR